MSRPSGLTRQSFSTGVLIALIVPLVVLMFLEGACRFLSLDQRFAQSPSSPQLLDMPTWMQREDNVRARISVQKTVDADALEWMSLFREGDGFRVHLIPSIERRIRNTFSRLPVDLERRYLVRTNSLGFRGPEITPGKTDGTYRILVFGDSSSFGWGVNQEETFSALLQKKLQAHAPASTRVEVANFAIPGDSSEYGKLLFEKFAPTYAPDLVLLGFGANDSKKVITPHTQQVERFRAHKTLLQLRSLLNHSSVVRTLAGVLAAAPPPPAAVPQALTTAVPRKRFQANIAEMGEHAKKSGARTLVLTLCSPLQYRRAAAKVANNRHYLFVDGQSLLLSSVPALASGALFPDEGTALRASLGPLLTKNSLLYISSDGCHPNRVGHQIVADALANAISPLLQRPLS